jgi:eukaryotic-like serine/threonine-protein kinase
MHSARTTARAFVKARTWLQCGRYNSGRDMAMASGARLGPYEILTLVGSGGMGEVYRARDTKLNREVALKILPAEFALDADRLARFKREAQVLASLDHPNIGAIYGFEDSDDVHALVLQLVEGPTLADRIMQGSVAVEEALPIARQIAEALEAAHEKGVIHRDLKPANIKLTADGNVKVLDFGLAKLLDTEPAISGQVRTNTPGLTNSPTITTPAMTQLGVILGTAAYMSPEQAKGKPADKRSDIWAFGCVLYEMLTGRRAFEGEDVSDTLAAVLRAEPLWSALPDLSPPIRALIDGCLRKNRLDRISDMSTARFLLNEPRALCPAPVAEARLAATQQQPLRVPLLAVAVLGMGALIGAGLWLSRSMPLLSVSRSVFTLPENQNFSGVQRPIIAMAPDGSQFVYVANGQLHVHSMSEFDSKPIVGTEGPTVTTPVFSPDSRSIAFYKGTDHAIKRIATTGGVAFTICSVDDAPYGMTWGSDGIIFAVFNQGIMRVSANGGTPEMLVKLNGGEAVNGPQMLPDGRAVLFAVATVPGEWDQAEIVVQLVKSSERKRLIPRGTYARYVPTGHIVYVSGGTLFAVPFDAKRLEVTGGPMPVVEGVRRAQGTGIAQYGFSTTGSLIYVPGPVSSPVRQLDLALVDGRGDVQPLKLPPGTYNHPRVSPDGKRVAFSVEDGRDANVWIYDLSGKSAMRRLTFGGRNRFPIWSRNGERITFQSDRDGDPAVFWQRADISGGAERLTKPEKGAVHIPESWSPTNDVLLFSVTNASVTSLWTYSERDRRTSEFSNIRSSTPTDAVFSPDGRWVAYLSTDEGRPGPYVGPRNFGLFVQPFPPTGEQYLISSGGGIHPMWSHDGRELLFNLPGQLMKVSVATRPTFTVGKPVQVPRGAVATPWPAQRSYDMTPDGKLLGVIVSGENSRSRSDPTQIRMVLNWFEELKQRVPTK